jgi:hypothetical protein
MFDDKYGYFYICKQCNKIGMYMMGIPRCNDCNINGKEQPLHFHVFHNSKWKEFVEEVNKLIGGKEK